MQLSRILLNSALLGTTALSVAVAACGGSDPPPQTAQGYPPQGYPQQGGYYAPPPQGGFVPQPVPQQGPPPASTFAPAPAPGPQPGPAPGPAPAPSGTMATPGPLAPPCQNDAACGLFRCNTQFQKCAFPCVGPIDCAAGSQCLMGVCAPKAPGT